MVYTRMPFNLANCAASMGSICPALFSPSVSSTMTLLAASEARSRFTAMANPVPMAVPPCNCPVSKLASPFLTTMWSDVMGTWVKASPS